MDRVRPVILGNEERGRVVTATTEGETVWAALCESSDIKERQRWSKRERACGMDIELVQNYLPVPLANRDMKKKLLMEIGEGGGGEAIRYSVSLGSLRLSC